MKPFLKGGFTLFGTAVAPALYLSGISLSSAFPISSFDKNIDWNWKSWADAYNSTSFFDSEENAEALLARAIPKESKIEKVFVNEDTKYLKNRQLGIKILASDSNKGDYGISPYKVFIASERGDNQYHQENLGELAKKIHVIEWEGSKEGTSEESYRGVLAVSFVPLNKLEVLLKQLSEQDQKIWDIDVRDILREAVDVNYASGKDVDGEELKKLLDHEELSSKLQQVTYSGISNETTYDGDNAKNRLFVQALRDDTNWVKRSWYKGEKLATEVVETSVQEEEEGEEEEGEMVTATLAGFNEDPKYEVTIPEKYLAKNGSGWLEFNEDLIKKHLKVEKEENEKLVISSPSGGEKVTINKKDLSTSFLIRRRNINVLRGVVKAIFQEEEIENLDIDKTTYSYLDLWGLMKKKFILDTFRDLHWECSGNEIPDESGWISLEEEPEPKKPAQKFCGKWDYPLMTDYEPDYDPVVELSKTVWDGLKEGFNKSVLPLCNLLEKGINPYLSSVYGNYRSFDPDSCEIKPKTQIVSEHDIPKEPELTEETIKSDLVDLPDKFGIYGKAFKDNKFVSTGSQDTNKEKLVPIVWSNKSFVRKGDNSDWSLSFNYASTSSKEEHKQVKITQVREWKMN